MGITREQALKRGLISAKAHEKNPGTPRRMAPNMQNTRDEGDAEDGDYVADSNAINTKATKRKGAPGAVSKGGDAKGNQRGPGANAINQGGSQGGNGKKFPAESKPRKQPPPGVRGGVDMKPTDRKENYYGGGNTRP